MNGTSFTSQTVVQTPTPPPEREVVKLPNIFHLIGEAFYLLKHGFWRFVLIQFLGFLVFPIIGGVVGFGIGYIIQGKLTVGAVAALFGFYIVFLLSYFWKYAVQINFCQTLSQGAKKIPFKRSFAYVLGIWVFGIVFGILINIGLVSLIIPGVILAIMYFLTPYVYVLEEKRIFHAAGLASRYVKGYKFALLARLIAFILVWIVAFIVIWLIFIAVGGIAFFSSAILLGSLTTKGAGAGLSFGTGLLFVSSALLISSLIITTVVEALQVGYFYKVYESLREIKQKAWQEGREVYDGYTLWKKILVSLFVVVFLVLFVISLISEITSSGKKQSNEYNQFNWNLNVESPFINNINTQFSPQSSNDQDGDYFLDGEEAVVGSNPTLKDTDGDGLSDFEEVKIWKTNPSNTDTDTDGLNDFDEVNIWQTDPNNPDTDGDGYPDGREAKNGYDPKDPLK